MPTNIGEIAGYHNLEAARFSALAQAARNEGNKAQAEYLSVQAARYAETAREQRVGMRHTPAHSSRHPHQTTGR
jgi:hypothetical protein